MLAGGPQLAWRLDDPSATVADSSGTGGYHGGVSLGQAGVLTGSPAITLTDGFASSAAPVAAPSSFSVELWFRTTTRTGGRLVGYGTSQTGTSSSYDRQVYMNDGGQLMFGVYAGGTHVAWSKNTYNDGTWHHAVATQGGGGMVLYVDGVKAATDPATTAQAYTGYWRVGNDNLTSWPRQPTSSAFEGSVDEAAVYGRALTAAEVLAHYTAPS